MSQNLLINMFYAAPELWYIIWMIFAVLLGLLFWTSINILKLRRPRRNLVREFGIQIFFKLIPVLVSGAPAARVDAVDAQRFVLQTLQRARALDKRDDRDNRCYTDDNAQHG